MHDEHRSPWLAVLALVATIGCQGNSASPAATPVMVEVQHVVETERQETRLLSGDVQPWEVLPLSFKVGGRIARIAVEEGDKVKKGAPIASLEARDYVLTRDLAGAQLDALSPHLHRAEALHAAAALPTAQLDEIEGKVSVARIQRAQAETQLAYAALQSPIDGVIVRRLASPGQMAGPSAPVVVLASLDPAKIELPVAQRDLALFREGDTIAITSVGMEGPLTGTVHSVGYSADEKTRTFPVVLKVKNPDLRLRAGMVVEARVTIARHRGVFVPLEAVQRDLEGRPAVLVVSRGDATARATLRPVRTGSILGNQVHVLEGLASGDDVIVRGLAADGDPVLVTTREAKEPPR